MLFRFLRQLFGSAQERQLSKYRLIKDAIHLSEKQLADHSDDQIREKTAQLKERHRAGASLEDLLPEAFATLREACRRLQGRSFEVMGHRMVWDMVPYDEQLLGGIAMHFGNIAEMQTGEGKTLTACLALYLNALAQIPVHLVTVNDYLAERDCQWNQMLFGFLGLHIGAITQSTPPHQRGEIYRCDVVYATASEFGFDYLRDNSMAHSADEQVQRGQGFAIVDEIDSILIDEARTPLIISGPAAVSTHMYDKLQETVALIVRYQREHCNQLAQEAWEQLMRLGVANPAFDGKANFSRDDQTARDEAMRKLWLVSKGLPHHALLKQALELPALRAELNKLDLKLYGESGKEERAALLSEHYVLVDERNSEYELTDRGAAQWHKAKSRGLLGNISSKVQKLPLDAKSVESAESDDFIMLDLGYEYSEIDRLECSDEERMERKLALQTEDAHRKERMHNLRQLLRAHLLMERDVDYIVQNQKIVIIDEHTGRPQPGRRYSDGLHQALEAKERVPIQRETQTYASITLQNYFRLYDKLAGMSGTAITEGQEFREIYNLDVLQIPTHLPSQRVDEEDEVYMTEREKLAQIVSIVESIHLCGRPILIGTESVEASEKLSRLFEKHGLVHTVLNAKQNDQEAQIISRAGQKSAITISTNMAGRGTDIRLGEGIAELGGLHVIGASRHQSRRIDRQLRGRCARQGDPGSSKFYVSFEDQLIRLFASPRMAALLKRFRPPEGEPISSSLLSRSIETAQKRVEHRNYTMRKHTLEFDDVMNVQRNEVYALRGDLLHTSSALERAEQLLRETPDAAIEHFFQDSNHLHQEGIHGFVDWAMAHFPVSFDKAQLLSTCNSLKDLKDEVSEKILSAFAQKRNAEEQKLRELGLGTEVMAEALQSMMLRRVDHLWQEHLLAMDHLRTQVHLQTLGQKDPLLEYKEQAFVLFAELSGRIREMITGDLFRFELIAQPTESFEAT